MPSPGSRLLIVASLSLVVALFGLPAIAATPAFIITATNITMPPNGSAGSSPFVVTSVNGYAGQVHVDCAYSDAVMGAKVPSCGIFVNPVSIVGPNKTAQGSLTLVPFGKTINHGAASITGKWRSSMPVFAAALLGGLWLRRKRKGVRGLLLLLMLGAIAVAGVTTCASGKSGTSGMFPYTITAVDIQTNTTVSAPFTVTVP